MESLAKSQIMEQEQLEKNLDDRPRRIDQKPQANLLPEYRQKSKRNKKKRISKLSLYLLIVFVIIAFLFGWSLVSTGQNLSKSLGNTSLWGQFKHLVGSSDKEIAGEEDDRINILLLGMGGLEHDGPFLTDTIMIASFKPSANKVALISIPRDLSVNIPGYGRQKINHVNAYGEAKESDTGGEFASEIVSQTFGVPIHYYIRIDFDGFKKIIDDLGDITVDVENVLDDERYPIKGQETATTSQRYEHLYIKTGAQKMDSELALKYVRSRQAKGIEGSDFARSKRQQLVLQAVKDKMLSLGTIINPIRINKLTNTLSDHLTTNLQAWEIIKLFNMGKDVNEEDIIRRVFTDSPDGELYPFITEGGAFVLIPKVEDFSQLKLITQNIFDPEALAQAQPKYVEIHNGTKINGLAYQTSQYIQSIGYQITRVKNAPTQDYQKTVVYNLVEDLSDETAKNIAELIDAQLAPLVPAWIRSTSSPEVSPNTDILIILGQDRQNL